MQADLIFIGIVLWRRMRVVVLGIQSGVRWMQVQGMGDAFHFSRMQVPLMLMERSISVMAVGGRWMKMVKWNQEEV